MNLIDAVVTRIISRSPRFYYKKYWVKVEFNAMGVLGVKNLMFNTIEEAEALKVGHE
jgi:hypothetical protein